MRPLRIIYMGTPDFAVPALQTLHESNHEVIALYTQPPRPKGRGHRIQQSPTHIYADKYNIPVFHPKNFKTPEAVEEFQSLKPDIVVVAAYGLILPKVILDTPELGCINIHASLLPRWRGASPIQHAIWYGDKHTGITYMQMDEGLDTGDMLLQETCDITAHDTSSSLHEKLAKLGGEHILECINHIETLNPVPQDNTQTTYAPLLTKENGLINWSKSAKSIDCQYRAFQPWPAVHTYFEGAKFKVTDVSPAHKDSDQSVGKILDRDGHIVCGDGSVLRINTIQPEGKKSMEFVSAINGGYFKVGDIFQ